MLCHSPKKLMRGGVPLFTRIQKSSDETTILETANAYLNLLYTVRADLEEDLLKKDDYDLMGVAMALLDLSRIFLLDSEHFIVAPRVVQWIDQHFRAEPIEFPSSEHGTTEHWMHVTQLMLDGQSMIALPHLQILLESDPLVPNLQSLVELVESHSHMWEMALKEDRFTPTLRSQFDSAFSRWRLKAENTLNLCQNYPTGSPASFVAQILSILGNPGGVVDEETWYGCLQLQLMYGTASASMGDAAELTEQALEATECSAAENPYPFCFLRCMQRDVSVLVKAVRELGFPWFCCHFMDLLYHGGCLDGVQFNDSNLSDPVKLRDDCIQKYADSIRNFESAWAISAIYLDQCYDSAPAMKLASEILLAPELSTELITRKVLRSCDQLGLEKLSEEICKKRAQYLLEKEQHALAMQWILRTEDSQSICDQIEKLIPFCKEVGHGQIDSLVQMLQCRPDLLSKWSLLAFLLIYRTFHISIQEAKDIKKELNVVSNLQMNESVIENASLFKVMNSIAQSVSQLLHGGLAPASERLNILLLAEEIGCFAYQRQIANRKSLWTCQQFERLLLRVEEHYSSPSRRYEGAPSEEIVSSIPASIRIRPQKQFYSNIHT
eukprot:TRINITY_DN7502_c0_g1_i1.p1 TRINITY_DN7502_c0_g1~~TRINITY_DN7502_c0_g1_i1.p1  ORF type:complete len:609 (+),score=154.59 TRINITY_DN7502_c0_g1_i1:73-1899(+)